MSLLFFKIISNFWTNPVFIWFFLKVYIYCGLETAIQIRSINLSVQHINKLDWCWHQYLSFWAESFCQFHSESSPTRYIHSGLPARLSVPHQPLASCELHTTDTDFQMCEKGSSDIWMSWVSIVTERESWISLLMSHTHTQLIFQL